LKENGASEVSSSTIQVSAAGIEAAPSETVQSPETYVGYRRAEHFASPESVIRDAPGNYTPPARPSLNQWGLRGSWNVGAEGAVLQQAPGAIVFHFHARDLHLVVGRTDKGTPVRFKVHVGRRPAWRRTRA
jgi:thioredoxin family protein